MKGMCAENNVAMTHKSMDVSKLSTRKKDWHSPELTEVDYTETNSAASGSGTDGMAYAS